MTLEMHLVRRFVADGGIERTILSVENLHAEPGEQIAVSGSSGSGKTTLLRVLSGISTPDEGTVRWDDTDLTKLSQAQRDAWRGANCGFLFQDFGLFDGLTAIENVMLPQGFVAKSSRRSPSRAKELLDKFQIRADTRTEKLLRGEMQRTALARLLMGSPKVILADEPTASLDKTNGVMVMDALRQASQELGATLFVVSHDPTVTSEFQRVLCVHDGVVRDKICRH